MKKLSIQKEAKKPKYVEIGDGFYVNKVGKDPNGNSCVWVQKGAGRSKKIQLVGNIPNKKDIISDGIEFFQDKNDPDTQNSVKALKDYYKKYLMKEKKSNVVASNEDIIRDKLKREFEEVDSNMVALHKELKQTNLNKKDITLMISWAYEALGRAFKVIKSLDTKLVK